MSSALGEVLLFPAGSAWRPQLSPGVALWSLALHRAHLALGQDQPGWALSPGGSSPGSGSLLFLPPSSQAGCCCSFPEPSQIREVCIRLFRGRNRIAVSSRAGRAAPAPRQTLCCRLGSSFPLTSCPGCPAAAGSPKGLAPKLSLTADLPTPFSPPPSLQDALPSSFPALGTAACILLSVGRCPQHPLPQQWHPWRKGATGWSA